VRTRQIGERLIEQAAQGLRVFLELVLARFDVRKDVAEGPVLRFVPAGADPALRAPVRDVIDGRNRLREQAGVAIRDAEDKAADPDARGVRRRGGQYRGGFEAVAGAIPMGCLLEVIGEREPIEAVLVREAPQPPQLSERPAEVADVDAELDTARLIPVVVGVLGTTRRRGHVRRRAGRVRWRRLGSAAST
jgi:hypothetical protein